MKTLRTATSFWALTAFGLLAACFGGSCAASRNNNFGGGGQSGTGASQGHGADDMMFDSGTGAGTTGDAGACAADSTTAEQLPLDMYIMLDRSGSMDGSSWTAVTGAIKTFVTQPGLTGIGVGLQYFPIQLLNAPPCVAIFCQSNGECGDPACGPCVAPGVCQNYNGGLPPDSCADTDYAKPAVEIAPVASVVHDITGSMLDPANKPTGNTPTYPALKGALDHAKAWAGAHANHVVIAVLATDGEPTECDPQDIPSIAQLASSYANGTPKILTFVIGVGSSTGNLNSIAQGGGTGTAFKVDTNASAGQQFLDALNTIRGAALGCNYAIPMPEAGAPDFSRVNVQYTPGGGASQIIPQVNDKGSCPSGGDGWYYDNPAAPTQIVLCDASCQKVSQDDKGRVDVLTGCKTIVN